MAVPFFIAAWFGTSPETDAFFFSYTWITFVTLIFSPVLESVVVPFIAHLRARGGDAGGFVGRVLLLSFAFLTPVAGAGWLLITLILPWVTDFSDPQIPLVQSLLGELSPLLVLTAAASVAAGTLNAYRRFAFPTASPGVRAVVVLAFGFMFKKTLGIHAVTLGYLVGEAVRLVALLLVLGRLPGLRLSLAAVPAGEIGDFLRKAGNQTLGMTASELSPMVDKTMASWLGAGAISILSYAERLYIVPVIFLSSGFLVTLLSHWSGRYYGAKGTGRLNRSLRRALIFVAILSLLATAVLCALHRPLINLFFGRPRFGSENLSEVSHLYLLMNLALCPHLISYVLTRAFLIRKNTAVIRNLGIIRLIAKIALNLLLIRLWGLTGIAVATVLTAWLGLFYLAKTTRQGWSEETAMA